MAFRDLLPSYFDDTEENDGSDLAPPEPPPAFRDTGNPADVRTALQQTLPESESAGPRFLHGLLHDVGELGYALGSPIYYGAREAYRTAKDPAAEFAKASDVVSKIAEDPYGAAQKAASAVGNALIEPYTPREGEGFLDVAKRNVLDRPLGTLMDASALVGIPAGLAEKAGVTGAKVFADAARSIDPISLADSAIKGALRTKAPDALARLEASREIASLASEQKTRATAIHEGFKQQTSQVFDGLAPEEKALFFPYVEGRLKAMTEGPQTGVLQELTPEGTWQPRGVDQGRLDRLEAARQQYLPILDQFETEMGYKPEQVGQAAAEKAMRGQDPLDPTTHGAAQDAYQQAFQEATDRQNMRRTLSTRTALDAAKETEFAAKIAQQKLEGGAASINDVAARYPVTPSTPQEAMDVMGPQGGVYFPHSGEVFTRDQVNIGNLLTKVREAVPWKQNKGALFRSGALDTMDPEKALLRTHAALLGGTGRAEILDALGQKFGTKLEAGYKFGTDPDFRAGTHQLMRPGLLHQEGALGENMQDLMTTLLRNGDDPAVAGLNMQDLTEKAAQGMDARYPLRKDAPVYKVPKGVADAIANWSRSMEPSTNAIVPWLDAAADPFNFVTLNLRPARILNNMVGNTLFQVLQGIHPFSTTGIGAMSDMAQGLLAKAGLPSTERGAKIANVFDLPGVSSGGVSGAQDYASRTETFLKDNPIAKLLGGKQLAAYGDTMQRLNQHVENTARALSTVFELRQQSPGLLARMASSAKTTMDVGDRIEQLASQGVHALDDADYVGALKNVNRFLNDYGRTSAFERTTLRRIFPYQKFYRHSIELALRTPFEQPAKMAVLRTIGKAAKQDFDETLSGWGFDPKSMVLPWQQSSVPVDLQQDENGKPFVRLLNMQGPSPFSLLDASGDPGQQGLSAIHPAVKAALETALGINLFTMQPFKGQTTTYGGKEVDPATGLVDEARHRPGPISQFAKQFFPVQLARDLLAGKRQPLDTASLVDQIVSQFENTPGTAYKVDERGQAIERPKANPWARLFVPVPQTLEAPTHQQMSAETAALTEQYRKLGRARPDLQEVLKQRRRAAAAERQQQERPYTVPLRKR